MLKLNQIHHGDCLELMKEIPDQSIDTIITDPPYGLKFMNQKWDYQIPNVENFQEMLRVCKSGATMLCFCGTRTWHRIACNIEDAGWEIKDTLMWIYGKGFPKSLNIAKSLKKKGMPYEQWEGWGTALKPAYEPIIVAMKPVEKNYVNNALEYGIAGINIDECRIPYVTVGDGNLALNPHLRSSIKGGNGGKIIATEAESRFNVPNQSGRWPANIILDEDSGAILDKQTEILKSCKGGASRFFYCTKASQKERGEYNNHPTVKPIDLMTYLNKLTLTPTGGIVLDPYSGSGSTAIGALKANRQFIGIEKELKYVEIANKRIKNFKMPN